MADTRLEIALERPSDQPGRVRILHKAGGRDGAGNADADSGCPSRGVLQSDDERDDGVQGGGVVVARRVDANACALAAAVEDDAFDLRAAEIDSYAHKCGCA